MVPFDIRWIVACNVLLVSESHPVPWRQFGSRCGAWSPWNILIPTNTNIAAKTRIAKIDTNMAGRSTTFINATTDMESRCRTYWPPNCATNINATTTVNAKPGLFVAYEYVIKRPAACWWMNDWMSELDTVYAYKETRQKSFWWIV